MEDGWVLSLCKNGRRSCDNAKKEASEIFDILSKLESSFDLCSRNPNMVEGLDTAIFPLMINGQKITVGWDIWSGIFIMADTAEGDIVVEQVYSCLKDTL